MLLREELKYRWDEVQVRYRGFKKMGLMPNGLLYVIKPLIVGLISQKFLAKVRRMRREK